MEVIAYCAAGIAGLVFIAIVLWIRYDNKHNPMHSSVQPELKQLRESSCRQYDPASDVS